MTRRQQIAVKAHHDEQKRARAEAKADAAKIKKMAKDKKVHDSSEPAVERVPKRKLAEKGEKSRGKASKKDKDLNETSKASKKAASSKDPACKDDDRLGEWTQDEWDEWEKFMAEKHARERPQVEGPQEDADDEEDGRPKKTQKARKKKTSQKGKDAAKEKKKRAEEEADDDTLAGYDLNAFKKTFARRFCPSTKKGQLKWLAAHNAFNTFIYPVVVGPSKHEDPKLQF